MLGLARLTHWWGVFKNNSPFSNSSRIRALNEPICPFSQGFPASINKVPTPLLPKNGFTSSATNSGPLSLRGFAPENWSSRNERISDFSVLVEIGRLWIGPGRKNRPSPMQTAWNEISEMKKRYTGNQIVGKLRQADVLIGKGKTVPEVCREIEVYCLRLSFPVLYGLDVKVFR